MEMRMISLLTALMLMSAMFVPAASAAVVPEVSAEKISERLPPSPWETDHTIKVTHETTYLYTCGTLEVTEVYSGIEFQKKFGVPDFTRKREINVDPDTAVALNFKEGTREVRTEISFEVFTTEQDPPQILRSYDYPQWIYVKDGSIYLQLNEPINIAWENSNYNSVKQEIIEKGWTDYPLEDTYYVYDSVYGWIADDGLASDPFRLLGGYHIRIWSLSDGDIAGAAHQDSGVPHHAIGFENAEELVAGFYNDPDDTQWHVYQDDYALNSYIQSPYSNGMATRIFWS